MSAALSFQRLLWKEARVLRNVWLGCAIGVLCLMLVILAIGESTTHSQGYSQAFWVFMVWIPPVYVLAALATMFAGEREEGTLVWLTALSPRLATVFSSRLLFVIVTAIALQVWYGLSALMLSQFDERPPTAAEDLQEYVILMSFLLVESLAFGMLWSLQTNRPLNAILYAAITMIVVNGGAASLVEALGGRVQIRAHDYLNYAFGFWGWARCLLICAVMVGNWKLARNWLEGHPWDWGWILAWWSQRRAAAVAVSRAGTSSFPMEASEPWRRAWQRLRWLEWQGIRTFAGLSLAATLLSCASIHVRGNGQPTFGFSFMICWIVLLVGGLMSWHGEQSQQRFRALVRLGMSPLALWMNKLACWFTATALAITVILGTTALWWTVLSQFENDTHRGYHRPIRELMDDISRQPQAEALWMMSLNYALILFLLGFTSSHLMRKTVLSLGVALMGSVVFAAWFVICGQTGLPWFLFFAPIMAWLLWISVTALPAWWTEQTTWRIPYGRMATLAVQTLFPLGLLALAAGYRIWEVPTTTGSNAIAWMERNTSLDARHSPNAVQIRRDWLELNTLLRQPLSPPENAQTNREMPDALHPDNHASKSIHYAPLLQANRDHLNEIRDRVRGLTSIVPDAKPPQMQSYTHLLLVAAQERLSADDPEASLAFLQAGVRLAGMLNRFTPFIGVRHAGAGGVTIEAYGEMMRWAQHPKQTEVVLRRGLWICAVELPYWQTQPEEIDLVRDEERKLVEDVYLPWDRARARKLVEVKAANRQQYLWNCRQGSITPGYSAIVRHKGALYKDRAGVVRHNQAGSPEWNFVPAEEHWAFDDSQGVYGLNNDVVKSLFFYENQYRATVTRMAVMGHRRLTGTLPTSLFDVMHYFDYDQSVNPNKSEVPFIVPEGSLPPHYVLPLVPRDTTVINDIWTGALFGYAPNGFPMKEPEFSPNSLYRRPLLWSATVNRALVNVQDNVITLRDDGHRYLRSNPIRQGNDQGYTEDWVYPIPPQDPVKPAAQPE